MNTKTASPNVKCLFGFHDYKLDITIREPHEKTEELTHQLRHCQSCLMYVKLTRYVGTNYSLIWEGLVVHEDQNVINICEYEPCDDHVLWQITKCDLNVEALKRNVKIKFDA